jgi:hypothetical protein
LAALLSEDREIGVEVFYYCRCRSDLSGSSWNNEELDACTCNSHVDLQRNYYFTAAALQNWS